MVNKIMPHRWSNHDPSKQIAVRKQSLVSLTRVLTYIASNHIKFRIWISNNTNRTAAGISILRCKRYRLVKGSELTKGAGLDTGFRKNTENYIVPHRRRRGIDYMSSPPVSYTSIKCINYRSIMRIRLYRLQVRGRNACNGSR